VRPGAGSAAAIAVDLSQRKAAPDGVSYCFTINIM